MPDSQQYPLNLYLSDKAENIVVFILKSLILSISLGRSINPHGI